MNDLPLYCPKLACKGSLTTTSSHQGAISFECDVCGFQTLIDPKNGSIYVIDEDNNYLEWGIVHLKE